MIDILVTTYNRVELLKKTLNSLDENTRGILYRLFIADDSSSDGTPEYLASIKNKHLMKVVLSKHRFGVVYQFNSLWWLSRYYDSFHESYPYMCYLQDDLEIIEKDWLLKLLSAYEDLKERYQIGFFSGYDCVEHPVRKIVSHDGVDVLLKDSQGAPNLIGKKSFWESIGMPPQNNPDGSRRGFPDKGRGSQIDLWLTGCMSRSIFVPRVASLTCSYLQKKTVMVIPMMKHLGQSLEESTWRSKNWRSRDQRESSNLLL